MAGRLSRLVRLYHITSAGITHTIQCDVDEVLSEGEYFLRWANALFISTSDVKALVTGNTRVFTTDHADSACRVKGVESPRDSMRRAVMHMPEGAPYAVLFVGAADWNTTQHTIAHGIVKEQHLKAAEARIVALEGKLAAAKSKYMAPQPGTMTTPVDPLMEWYTLNKQAKATKEDLLAKLRAALIEKAKDPAMNPMGATYNDSAGHLLEVLSASTENIAFLGTPARFAAYEACGLRFGPVLATPELRLSTLDPVSELPHQVRMTDLPWVCTQ